MKRFYLIAILMTICGMTAMAQDRPDITHQTTGRDRIDIVSITTILTPVFDEPYIFVNGCENTYCEVAVTEGTVMEWWGVIGKEYGTMIEYEFSCDKSYVITLKSSQGSTMVWRLENGVLNGTRKTWGDMSDQIFFDYIPLFDR